MTVYNENAGRKVQLKVLKYKDIFPLWKYFNLMKCNRGNSDI